MTLLASTLSSLLLLGLSRAASVLGLESLARLSRSLEAGSSIVSSGLRVILLQDVSVLADKPLLLHLDDNCLASLVLLLGTSLIHFHLSLSPVDGKLLLPETLDLAFVLLLAHSALLSVHLLETLVLGKLLRELVLKLILHASLLSKSLFLQSLLVGLREEEVVSDLLALLDFFSLSLASLLLQLLHV